MNDEKQMLKTVIEDGIEITGAAGGAALGFLVAGPAGAAGVAAGGYVATKALKRIGIEIYNKVIGKREKTRIGASTIYAADKIREKIHNGNSIREDGFFDTHGIKRANAEEIFEGVLLKSKDSYQELKVKHYGEFWRSCI